MAKQIQYCKVQFLKKLSNKEENYSCPKKLGPQNTQYVLSALKSQAVFYICVVECKSTALGYGSIRNKFYYLDPLAQHTRLLGNQPLHTHTHTHLIQYCKVITLELK